MSKLEWREGLISNRERAIQIEVEALQFLHALAKGACHDGMPYDVAFYVNAERKIATLFRDITRMIEKGN